MRGGAPIENVTNGTRPKERLESGLGGDGAPEKRARKKRGGRKSEPAVAPHRSALGNRTNGTRNAGSLGGGEAGEKRTRKKRGGRKSSN